MNKKKISLPVIIIAAALVLMAVYCVLTCIAKKPTVTQMDFPFSITYELNGETITIEDVYRARFTGNGSFVDPSARRYEGFALSVAESSGSNYILTEGPDGSITLYANFYPDYMLGDSEYDYYSHYPFEPYLSFFDPELGDFDDEQTLMDKGAKLISWEYPAPIENSLVFSHIAYLCGQDVLPLLGIGLLALLAMLFFVKKQTPSNIGLDRVCKVCNILIILLFLPLATIAATFSDIMGSSQALDRQLFYIVPAFTALGVAASVGLRRKGRDKAGLLAPFIGPVIFGLSMLLEVIS